MDAGRTSFRNINVISLPQVINTKLVAIDLHSDRHLNK